MVPAFPQWCRMTRLSFDEAHVDAGPLRWLYVDFNSYFASVEQQLNPALRGRPVIVVPVETDSTSAIAASYEAKAYGIRTNTPVYEARKLCPEVVCVLANHEHYVAYHQRILAEIERHVPVTEVCSIDEVACRLKGNENSREQVIALAHRIKAGLAEHVGEYVRCSIGVAPNKYLGKIATDIQKPDGLTIIDAADIMARLQGLKLSDLPGVGRKIEKRLHQAGIFSMPQLLALSARQMYRLWGNVWGERLWYLLRGLDMEPAAESRRSTVGHSHVLAPQLRPPSEARFVARRLTIKAASRLRRMGYYARAMSLSVRSEAGVRYGIDMPCERAQDSMTFLALLEEGWGQLMAELRHQRVKKVSVTLHGLESEAALQEDLFSARPVSRIDRGKRERLSKAMDVLNHRYGRDTVSLGMLPTQGRSFSGTKVAFTRIPDVAEFFE